MDQVIPSKTDDLAPNLAAAGVDQRLIDEFMGHQTEDMRGRYRHLFTGQRRATIESAHGASIRPPVAG